MIKKRFIDRQIEKSAAGKRATPFLRRLVFQTVDAVSRSHYARDYSMKCVQTAAATKMLLAKMGIDSRLTMGAVCFPKILDGGQFAGWAGFWDADHHVWLETEFNEVVDLSISQLHDHPRTIEREMQTPAIWWEQRNGCPLSALPHSSRRPSRMGPPSSGVSRGANDHRGGNAEEKCGPAGTVAKMEARAQENERTVAVGEDPEL